MGLRPLVAARSPSSQQLLQRVTRPCPVRVGLDELTGTGAAHPKTPPAADHVHPAVQAVLEVHPIPARHTTPADVWVLEAEHQPPRGRSPSPLGSRRRGRARDERRPGGVLERQSQLAGDRPLPQTRWLEMHAMTIARRPDTSCPPARTLDGAIASGSVSTSGGRRRGLAEEGDEGPAGG